MRFCNSFAPEMFLTFWVVIRIWLTALSTFFMLGANFESTTTSLIRASIRAIRLPLTRSLTANASASKSAEILVSAPAISSLICLNFDLPLPSFVFSASSLSCAFTSFPIETKFILISTLAGISDRIFSSLGMLISEPPSDIRTMFALWKARSLPPLELVL
ncbi:hypothetical protein D3C72_1633180 [compost metagenome]